MTTFAMVLTILGAATVARWLVKLFDRWEVRR